MSRTERRDFHIKAPNTSRVRTTTPWQILRATRVAAKGAAFNVLCRHILKRPFQLVIFAVRKHSEKHPFINWFLAQSQGLCVFFNFIAPDQYPTERHWQEFRQCQWGANE